MTGLRARQKADRHQRILDAATDLFGRMGYDAARIEGIAELAQVSVGTVYNYYENKGDILVAVVSMEVQEVLEAGASVVEAPPASVDAALKLLIENYYDHSLVYLSKGMWRTAMAISIQQPKSHFSKRYTELDRLLSAQVSQLVAKLQQQGVIMPGLDATAIGQMIFNNLNMMFTEFVKNEAMTLDELKDRVARQNGPLSALISRSHIPAGRTRNAG